MDLVARYGCWLVGAFLIVESLMQSMGPRLYAMEPVVIRWEELNDATHESPLPRELAELPAELEIEFSSNPVTATYAKISRHGPHHVYEYDVVVSAAKSVEIIQWGVVQRTNGMTRHYGFGKDDFRERFRSRDGHVDKGQNAVFKRAHYVGGLLEEEIVRWYLIGQTLDGRKVKGDALIRAARIERERGTD